MIEQRYLEHSNFAINYKQQKELIKKISLTPVLPATTTHESIIEHLHTLFDMNFIYNYGDYQNGYDHIKHKP